MHHPYLDSQTCIDRLVAWHRANGGIIVAYDFDNTVYDYHNQGHNYQEVIDLIKRAHHAGCYLIVFTGNHNQELVERFLAEHEIPYDAINEQAPFLPESIRRARKIYYNLLLDDAAGLASACAHLEGFLEILKGNES